MLFVDEQTAVERQLSRGRAALAHNEEVKRTGKGRLEDVRPSDVDPVVCRKRFQVFKEQTYNSLESLRTIFHYHMISADGPIKVVEAAIHREMAYQSSLELAPDTYAALAHLPLATEVALHARQRLVRRLDDYAASHRPLLSRVVSVIDAEIMPAIRRHAITGHVKIRSVHSVFSEPHAIAMVLDVLSERGFDISASTDLFEVPTALLNGPAPTATASATTAQKDSAGTAAGAAQTIVSSTRAVHKFYIAWPKGWRRSPADPVFS
jgi:adenylate kinase